MFESGFQRREWMGRHGLIHLKELYPKSFKWDIKLTEYEYESYDAYWTIQEDGKQKLYWVEIKTRSKDYDIEGYTLEVNKWNKMESTRKRLYIDKEDVIYIYINFTPSKTIIWNISNIKDYKLPIVSIKMNKYTEINRKDKTDKRQWLLPPSRGKIIPYILDENFLINKYYPKPSPNITKAKQIGFQL